APFLMGFILGPAMEENLRRSMLLARGDASVFLASPISAVCLGLALLAVLVPLALTLRRRLNARG
ncbi:MAG: tricarboxylic transporter, partial [Pseudomonadota bacterium]